jgi:serine/threonine protein kinase
MELVEGASLLGLRARYGDVRFALGVLTQLAEGLAAIHELGIVHRDLKPANVLVSYEGPTGLQVKISDFGVSMITQGASVAPPAPEPSTLAEPSARRRSEIDSSERATSDSADTHRMRPRSEASPIAASPLTETGALLGTPVYMAPELADGAKNAQPASDVFSLGVIAYELLTGARPWRDSPAFARLRGASVPPATPLSHYCPTLDPLVSDALDSCLSANPLARPTSKELAASLRSVTSVARSAT